MRFPKLLGLPLLAAALIFATEGLYFAQVVTTQQTTLAQSSKPVRFHYVCPMHPDVQSKKPGKCPKCKMKLEKKKVKAPEVTSQDQ